MVSKTQIKPEQKKNLFLPSNIVYNGKKIVNNWLDRDEFAQITRGYISKLDIPKADKDAIIDMIDDSIKKDSSYSVRYIGDKKLVSPEFYEVLSAMKLVSLLLKKDSRIIKILGIKDINVKTVSIYFPQSANYSLTDYEVSINGAHQISPRSVDRPTHKISIKSKVSSSKSNTVKFTDIFDNVSEVEKWMNVNKEQRVQGTIALSAVSSPSGRKLYYPIHALSKVVNQIYTGFSLDTISALKKISKKVYTVSDTKKTIVAKDYDMTEKENAALQEFLKKYVVTRSGTSVEYNLLNIVVACEKFLVQKSTKSNNDSNLNFYKMFYDNILKERKIAYSVAKISGNSIVFNYYSTINWETEYKTWIALRSKNYAGSLRDTLGLDV